MTPGDLARELDAARLGLHVADARIALVKRGAHLGTLHAWPAVGAMRIERLGGMYQPYPAGELAYIVAEPLQTSSDLAEPDWQLLDLVAFPTKDPSIMLTRSDQAWALGANNKSLSIAFDTPLTVHVNLFDWLAAGRNGLLIIDHERAADTLSFVPKLVAQSAAHAEQLYKITRRSPPAYPTILVARRKLMEVRRA